jgi:hypothetical protein
MKKTRVRISDYQGIRVSGQRIVPGILMSWYPDNLGVLWLNLFLLESLNYGISEDRKAKNYHS